MPDACALPPSLPPLLACCRLWGEARVPCDPLTSQVRHRRCDPLDLVKPAQVSRSRESRKVATHNELLCYLRRIDLVVFFSALSSFTFLPFFRPSFPFYLPLCFCFRPYFLSSSVSFTICFCCYPPALLQRWRNLLPLCLFLVSFKASAVSLTLML